MPVVQALPPVASVQESIGAIPDEASGDAAALDGPPAGDALPATPSAPAAPAVAALAGATLVTVADELVIGPEGATFQSANGRITVTVPPGAVSGPTRFSYAPVATVPKPQLGMRSAFSLDAVDGQGRAVHSFAQPLVVSYSYDQGTNGIGRRTSMSDPNGSTTWTYDARGRVTDESKTINGTGGGTFRTQWAYDTADRVKAMTYPGGSGGELGEQVTTTYNAAGQPYSLAAALSYVAETQYTAWGAVELRRLGDSGANQIVQDYVYYALIQANGRGRLQQLKTGISTNLTSLQDLTYTYDAIGNTTVITDAKAGGVQVQSFGYDALHRLTSAQATGGTGGTYAAETYAYSASGNITSKAGTSYAYNDSAHKHAVTHLGGVQKYWYDGNANMTTRIAGGVTYTLTYD